MPRRKNPLEKLKDVTLDALKDPRGTAEKAVEQAKGTAHVGRMVAEQVSRTAVSKAGEVAARANRSRKPARTPSAAPRAESPTGLRSVPPVNEAGHPPQAAAAPTASPAPAKKAPAKKAPAKKTTAKKAPAKKATAKKTTAKKTPAKKTTAKKTTAKKKAAAKTPTPADVAKKAPAKKAAAKKTAKKTAEKTAPGDRLPPRKATPTEPNVEPSPEARSD